MTTERFRSTASDWSVGGPLGRRFDAVVEHWLLPLAARNPGLVGMFRDRDVGEPSKDLLPWSGEYAGKQLLALVDAMTLTGDASVAAAADRLVGDLLASQGPDGYLGPFEARARMTGPPVSKVFTTYFPTADRPGEWSGWFALDLNVFPLGAPVSAVSTVPGGTSLFLVGLDGKVWSTYYTPGPGGRWSGWFPVGDRTFPQGSTVTALSTVPGGTSLYVVDDQGRVCTNFFPAANGRPEWNGWFALDDTLVPVGSTVTALSLSAGATSLYAVGLDGRVATNFFPAADGRREWNGWFPLGDASFPIGSRVTAVSTVRDGTSTSLYAVGGDGRVCTNFFPAADGRADWNGWFPLDETVFPAGATVSALSLSDGATSLYALDREGRVCTNFFPAADGGARWNGWFALGDNRFTPGTSVPAVSTVPGGTSLYVHGLDGKVWTTFYPAADGRPDWNGWFALSDDVLPADAVVTALSLGPQATSLYVSGLGDVLWDLWGQYHCMLGLLRYSRVTGDDRALTGAIRCAEHVCATFQASGELLAYAGCAVQNQGIAHVLALLHGETGDARLLDMARTTTVSRRLMALAREGRPLHAGRDRRWEVLASIQSLVELALTTGDPAYAAAASHLWWSIARNDRHTTGGFSAQEEALGNPSSPLPIETCATVAWQELSVDVLRLTGDSRVADELELSLWNAALGAVDPDGQWWTYDTPMGGVPTDGMAEMALPPPLDVPPSRLGIRHSTVVDLPWQRRDTTPTLSCCSAGGARGLGSLARWGVMTVPGGPDVAGVAVSFFGPMRCAATTPSGRTVTITQDTDYPRTGRIRMVVSPELPEEFALHLRIPRWSRTSRVAVNDTPQAAVPAGSYSVLRRTWRPGDTVQLDLDMGPHVVLGAPRPPGARTGGSTEGLMAVYHGPLLLALETTDPAALPRLDLAHPPRRHRLEAVDGPMLHLDFTDDHGRTVTMLDFASAGQFQDGRGGATYVTWLPVGDSAGPHVLAPL